MGINSRATVVLYTWWQKSRFETQPYTRLTTPGRFRIHAVPRGYWPKFRVRGPALPAPVGNRLKNSPYRSLTERSRVQVPSGEGGRRPSRLLVLARVDPGLGGSAQLTLDWYAMLRPAAGQPAGSRAAADGVAADVRAANWVATEHGALAIMPGVPPDGKMRLAVSVTATNTAAVGRPTCLGSDRVALRTAYSTSICRHRPTAGRFMWTGGMPAGSCGSPSARRGQIFAFTYVIRSACSQHPNNSDAEPFSGRDHDPAAGWAEPRLITRLAVRNAAPAAANLMIGGGDRLTMLNVNHKF